MPIKGVLFDQYSRYKACADLLYRSGFMHGDQVIDIGSGPECLLGKFIPEAKVTYLDPLISSDSDPHRIAGDVRSKELDGRSFDCVTAVDVLEHVPAAQRQSFLERLSALGKNILVIGFPTSDSTLASETDKAIDAQYRAIFGHDYSWLEEHYRFGLPSLKETIEQLTKLGWHCQSIGHGHAPWLQELLTFVICAWDVPGLDQVVLHVSERFNRDLYQFDFRAPHYREFVVATRGLVPRIAMDAGGDHVEAQKIYRSLMDDAYRRSFPAAIRHLAHSEIDLARMQAKVEEVSAWGNATQTALIQRDAEILRLSSAVDEVSTWAHAMKRELDEQQLMRSTNSAIPASGLTIRQRLARTYVGRVVRRVRDGRRYRGATATLEATRTSLSANSGNLIIVFPIITWDFRWQRPQQIVSRLRNEGYAILYVAMSLAPLTRKIQNLQEAATLLRFDKLDRHIHQIWLHSERHLNIYTDAVKGNDLANMFSGLSAVLTRLKPKSVSYLIQFPGWWPLAEALRKAHGGKVVFDCMDDHAGFSTNTEEALKVETSLIESADLVIASSKILEERMHRYNPRTIQVKNGTEFEHFQTPQCNGELDRFRGRPIVGYYGAISDWFDMALVAQCARSQPDWHFVLIGATTGADLGPVQGVPNVHFLGEKKYTDLPGYLAYFDVCIIPFKLVPLTLATNPVKFYEYLSAGKPVVSVALPELLPYQEDCYVAQSPSEFQALLVRALNERDNPEKKERRLRLARENSWDSRAQAIVTALKAL